MDRVARVILYLQYSPVKWYQKRGGKRRSNDTVQGDGQDMEDVEIPSRIWKTPPLYGPKKNVEIPWNSLLNHGV